MRWWEATEFLAAVLVLKKGFQYFEYMYRPEFKRLGEALAAAWFAYILSQDRRVSIRLEPDRFPDFVLRVDNEIWSFEETTAFREDRRPDEEYRWASARKAAGLAAEDEFYDPVEEEEAAIPAIIRAIEKKKRRCYSSAPHLLVYVSLSCVTDKPLITNLLAFQLADLWGKDFKSCWLLWERSIFRLWPRAAMIRDPLWRRQTMDEIPTRTVPQKFSVATTGSPR
jgi:hypothetical protein